MIGCEKMNGIITEYRIDFTKFNVGDVFQFNVDTNKYINAILSEINKDDNKLTFVTLDEPIIVSLGSDSFVVKYGNTYSYNGFRRLQPTYKKEDDFGFGA